MVKVLDLYCGMGGLSLGFALGIENTEILGLDIDKYAVSTYNLNLSRYGCKAVVQDVLKWKPEGEYDLVIGSPPCQPYSIANTKKRGKDHPLYPTLPRFFDIVLELKPKAFLMENVKGLVMRRHRHLLEEQLDRVRGEYRVAWRVLNSAYYGVPQRRERVFVLGIRKDLGVKPSFPRPTHAEEERVTLEGKLHKWVTVKEAIGDLLMVSPMNMMSKEQVERILRERMDTSRHRAPMEFPDPIDKPSRTVSSHTVEGTKRETIVLPITEHVGTNVKIDISNPRGFGDASKVPNKLDLPTKTTLKGGGNSGAIPPLVELPSDHVLVNNKTYSYEWSNRIVSSDKPSYTITEHHSSGQLVEIPSDEWLRKHPPTDLGKPSNTIASNTGKNVRWAHNSIIVQGRYRRLTVRECMRLQSFPDWWSFPSNISISRKYKLVGEAVPPIMAYRLAIHIGQLLGLRIKDPDPNGFMLPYFKRSFSDTLSY